MVKFHSKHFRLVFFQLGILFGLEEVSVIIVFKDILHSVGDSTLEIGRKLFGLLCHESFRINWPF